MIEDTFDAGTHVLHGRAAALYALISGVELFGCSGPVTPAQAKIICNHPDELVWCFPDLWMEEK